MNIRDEIIDYMSERKYRPRSKEQLAIYFNIKRKDLKDFYDVLEALEKDGLIFKKKNNRYQIINNITLLKGEIIGNEKGFAFFVPEDKTQSDIFISPEHINTAFNGDEVIVNVLSDENGSRRKEGEVVSVINRKRTVFVGTFSKSEGYGFVVPNDKRINYDFFIPKAHFNGAKDSQKVVCEVLKWPEKQKNPEAKITEVLGYTGDKGTDISSIIYEFELPNEFPQNVIDSLEAIPDEVQAIDLQDRKDYSDLTCFTIDGYDAKDFDDAISIELLDNGNYNLGVHIADVSHYVKNGSSLDKEAFTRGNSVYLLDRVIPMLPEKLSNGLCSLKKGVLRLTVSVFIEIDTKGNVVKTDIFESYIKSKCRLIYDLVSDYLEESSEVIDDEVIKVKAELDIMKDLCELLRSKRMARGSIDFNFVEAKIILDENGRAKKIERYPRRIANKLIEEFMLVCNEVIAERFYWLDVPFIYRVHEDPKEEKIENLNRIIKNFGYSIKGQNDIHPKELQKLNEEISGKKEEQLISMLILRSLKKAKYYELNLGHFGLATEHYTHFTSPIRRYADLMIHRIIKDFIKGNLSASKQASLDKMLSEIADHISKTEKKAADAEMEVINMKKAEYMQQFINEEFVGTISSLTSFGMFVELDNTIEGLIRFASMKDDHYSFDENNYIVVGDNTHKRYLLGDKVDVILVDASAEKRTIEFVLRV